MVDKKRETFQIKHRDADGNVIKETHYAVVSPSAEAGREAQKVYNRAFADGLKAGGILRRELNTYMRERGLWNDELQAQHEALMNKLADMELQLKKGGIKLSEAKRIALDMAKTRGELRQLISERNELDVNTVEGQAENSRFNCLISKCLVYNDTGKPVYKTMEEYLENSTSDEAFKGASVFAQMMYDLDKDYEAKLPENAFLKQWKFVDDELRPIDKDGHFIDWEGRRVNADGYYVDDEGNLVDRDGNPLTPEGEYKVETQPFLDDDGNPIVVE